MKLLVIVLYLASGCLISYGQDIRNGIDPRYRKAFHFISQRDEVNHAFSIPLHPIAFRVSDEVICPEIGPYAMELLQWYYNDSMAAQRIMDSLRTLKIDVVGGIGCKNSHDKRLKRLSACTTPNVALYFSTVETRLLPRHSIIVATMFRDDGSAHPFVDMNTSFLQIIIVMDSTGTVVKSKIQTGDY